VPPIAVIAAILPMKHLQKCMCLWSAIRAAVIGWLTSFPVATEISVVAEPEPRPLAECECVSYGL
jgi:hypothetical protein